MSDPNARTGPDVETTGHDVETTGHDVETTGHDVETTGAADEEVESSPWEPHLHPERLAMTGEDVLHALDPRHWLPPNRRDDADEEYPHIRADWPAPFG